MYDSASPYSFLYVSRHSLNWTRCGTGSHSWGGLATRAWCDRTYWRRLIVLLCLSQTAAGRVDSVELRPADCYSSRLWRWQNCWLLSSWRPSTGLEHSSLFGVIGGSIGWLAGWREVETRVWSPAWRRDRGPSMTIALMSKTPWWHNTFFELAYM